MPSLGRRSARVWLDSVPQLEQGGLGLCGKLILPCLSQDLCTGTRPVSMQDCAVRQLLLFARCKWRCNTAALTKMKSSILSIRLIARMRRRNAASVMVWSLHSDQHFTTHMDQTRSCTMGGSGIRDMHTAPRPRSLL